MCDVFVFISVTQRIDLRREEKDIMQFGLSGCSGGFEATSLTRLADVARLAEDWGFTALWLNEEHFQNRTSPQGVPRLCLSPLVLAAYLAARTHRIRLGFSVLLLPLHQPLRLAEEIASLDALSNGRVDFGVSRAGNQRYLQAFGDMTQDQTESFRTALEFILRCWTEDSVSLGNEVYTVEPKPVQRPHPPVYIGAYTDASVSWAAQLGHTLIQHGIQSYANVRRCLNTFEQEGGARAKVPVGRFVYVGEDDDAARRDAWPVICQHTALLRQIGIAQRGNIVSEDELEPERFYHEVAIIGSPETCARRIATLRDDLGIRYLNVLASFFGFLPEPRLLQSLALFATEVMPKLSTGIVGSDTQHFIDGISM